MSHLARVLWFLLRFALYYATAWVRFFSKPGSRLIVPALLMAGAFLWRDHWHHAITATLRAADPGYEPETAVLDTVLVALLVGFIVAYALASKLLAVLLGAFPLPSHPLYPQRPLEAPKQTISPAPVRIVVPPLPRQRQRSAAG
ncbi:hypothetical protein [Roseicella aquatilis]|uniref:Uncharacterized protein n=1 Tax=Roseicella aquatilis TaxID=2527868 RepID=A0A4R4D226_9PROT|nr:hypothetical protein [Roseicella aquatilis]TCZ51908.1 hypothetical protein EXY23_26575 [Roseicella aquatilis]